MPISRRPGAAHERLTSLTAAPGGRAASSAGTGWVPPPPGSSAAGPDQLPAVQLHQVVLPFARPVRDDGRAVQVQRAERPAVRAGRGRHRADPPEAGDAVPGPGAGAALVPATLRGGRWGVSRRAALGALLALAVLATTLALRAGGPGDGGGTLAPARPVSSGSVSVPGDGATSGRPASATEPSGGPGAGAPAAGAGPALVVHVVGQVTSPGLVTVADGSRVADALAAAGGATSAADLSGLNLARPVVDGEQLVVPLPGEVVAAPAGPPAGGGGAGQVAAPVDLNRADLAALDTLPGIGPVLAQRILDWRAENGRFTSVDELGEVSGIGDALLGRLRDAVTV